MNLKDVKALAKQIEKEINTNGWTINAHTATIALVAQVQQVKEIKPKKDVKSK